MPVTDMQELLKHELGDLLYAERTILKGLRKMIREVSNPAMQQRMEQHVGETEQQIANLERAFEAMGEKVKATKCPGILGIQEEHDEFKREESPSKAVLEAFNLGSGLRVEHYEIAAYRSAMALAKSLGQREVAGLLKQNLEQEVAMARFIETSSAEALRMAQAQAAEQGAAAAKRAAKKAGATKTAAAAKKGGAAKKAAAKGGASRRAASKRATAAA